MTKISAKSGVITLINVFIVEPANQQRLIELLTEATEVSVCRAPGFVSASLHRSTDGTKVTMYAQWRSIDHYQAMRQDPVQLPFLEEALKIAKFEPGVYEVVRTFGPLGKPDWSPLTLEEVVERYRGQVSGGTLRNWRSMRIGPSFIKIGKAVLYPLEELDRWDRRNLVVCRPSRLLPLEEATEQHVPDPAVR